MEPRLLIKVLPRIPQVECDFWGAGRVRRRDGHLTRKPLGRRRRLFIPKRTVRPLPHRLPIGLGEFSGGVQVVAVHGVGLAVDHSRNGHGPIGRGQPQVLRAARGGGAAFTVFGQQAAVFCVHIGPAQFLGIAGGGAPEFAEEEVEQLLDEAGLFALGVLAFVAVIGQQVVQVLGAGGLACGAVASSGSGLLKAQQPVDLAGVGAKLGVSA